MSYDRGVKTAPFGNKPFTSRRRTSSMQLRQTLLLVTLFTPVLAMSALPSAAALTMGRPGVVLHVPDALAAEPALARLAGTLSDAVAEMAPRVPVILESPLEIVVEEDYVAQGRHLKRIGPAIVAADGRIHLVYHPGDLDAYRHAVARALLGRAELELSPWFEDGAALWLSRGWYGRDAFAWLPDLAAARVLPTAEELLAEKRQNDGSSILWPPVAAAVVDKVPGATVREKRAERPSAEAIGEMLRTIAAGDPHLPTPSPAPPFLHGISLAMANGLEIGYHAPGIDAQLERLRELGADSVSLMPFAYQPAPTQPDLWFLNRRPSSETDVGLVHAARRAHAHGFHVLWKPHIWVSHDSWPGEIEMGSEDDWQSWWRSYRRWLVHHAVLARFTGSEMLSVGVELGKTVSREKEWRELIAAVRQVYPGRLTYAGNWWGDYDRVAFWDALDAVGVDAYFPLHHESEADREALAAGARKVVGELAKAAETYGKPVILTEVGYAARHSPWVSPHEEGGEVSEEHQHLAYEVFLDTLGRPDWLAGMYIWKVFSHPSVENRNRPDFRFLGRSAEKAVRGYFTTAE